MAQAGTLLRFDSTRGYGFIAPDEGGADVFVHVNEFQEDEIRFSPGTRVEFEVMDGERGRKAFAVRVAEGGGVNGAMPIKQERAADDDGMCDVLSGAELRSELTEMFLNGSPELTGAQILQLRGDFLRLAQKHGWVEE